MQEDIQLQLALIHSQGDKVELHEVVVVLPVAKVIQIQRNLDYKNIRHHAYTR
jgi:hypothetical protein